MGAIPASIANLIPGPTTIFLTYLITGITLLYLGKRKPKKIPDILFLFFLLPGKILLTSLIDLAVSSEACDQKEQDHRERRIHDTEDCKQDT